MDKASTMTAILKVRKYRFGQWMTGPELKPGPFCSQGQGSLHCLPLLPDPEFWMEIPSGGKGLASDKRTLPALHRMEGREDACRCGKVCWIEGEELSLVPPLDPDSWAACPGPHISERPALAALQAYLSLWPKRMCLPRAHASPSRTHCGAQDFRI